MMMMMTMTMMINTDILRLASLVTLPGCEAPFRTCCLAKDSNQPCVKWRRNVQQVP